MIEFKYEDAQNTTLIEVSPSESVVIPKNVIKIKDSTVVDRGVSVRPLEALRNILKYLSFEEESKLENLGIGTFSSFTQLISVNLSMCNHLKDISSGAFLNSNLREIFLPMNGILNSIRSGAFFHTNLIIISIPDSVSKISGFYSNEVIGGPFGACLSLTRILISENSSLTSIGYAIGQYSPVTSFFIPKNCQITGGTFNLMTKLRVTIDSRNTYLRIYNDCIYSYNYSIFCWVCFLNQNILTFHPSCTTIDNEAFRGYSTKYDLVIPSLISTIKDGAFRECSIRSIIFQNDMAQISKNSLFYFSNAIIKMPRTLKVIKSEAINSYYGKYIEFYSEMQRIEENGFKDCGSLEVIKFNKLNNNMIIDSNSFNNCGRLRHLIFPFESSDIITFNSTCLTQCNSFIGIRFYLFVPRNIKRFDIGQTSLDVSVSSTNSNGDLVDCGKFHINQPFDERCKIPIHSCNRFSSIFNIQHIHVFILMIIE